MYQSLTGRTLHGCISKLFTASYAFPFRHLCRRMFSSSLTPHITVVLLNVDKKQATVQDGPKMWTNPSIVFVVHRAVDCSANDTVRKPPPVKPCCSLQYDAGYSVALELVIVDLELVVSVIRLAWLGVHLRNGRTLCSDDATEDATRTRWPDDIGRSSSTTFCTAFGGTA